MEPRVRAPSIPRWGAAFLVLSGWAVSAAVFFRGPVFSGFAEVTGDNGDTRLIVYLHEHWVQVFRGLAAWRDPGFFYPTTDTLGYSDTFLLDEVFYAPLRWVGADPFLSYQWTLLLLSLVGYLGAYRLLGALLPDHRAVCGALAITFAFSNMFYVQAGHTQLYSVYWLPVVLLLFLRIREQPASALGPAFLAGLLIGLLFLSTFYVAWFFLWCSFLWLATRWLLGRLGHRTAHRPGVREVLQRYRTAGVALAAGAAVGGIPFLLVYLPHFGSSRSFDVVVGYAAQPRDMINTGARNYFWGPLTRAVYGSSPRLTNGELGFGLTPALLITLLAATVYLVRRFAADRGDRRVIGTALATAITCCSAIVLPMKLFGLSLWYFLWLLVPGARAIRAIDRIGVIAAVLAPVVLAFVVADLLRRAGNTPLARRIVVGSVAVTLVLVVEQFNGGRNAGLDRRDELAAVQAVPSPPSTCTVFYLAVTANPAPRFYVSSIDAMLISQQLTSRGTPLPTINGFSGQFPTDSRRRHIPAASATRRRSAPGRPGIPSPMACAAMTRPVGSGRRRRRADSLTTTLGRG